MNNKNNYGNVYEILLPNGKYVYVCWIEECSFGIFNYVSDTPAELDQLLAVGFKTYKEGKETAVKKKIWKLIGHIDLEKENIKYPDMVIFLSYDKAHFIECSRVMRNGNPQIVPQEDYLALLKKGYIYGFFDKYEIFERWLSANIENYPENQNIFPLP
jgi:hypothetical protein